jgi:internalin A
MDIPALQDLILSYNSISDLRPLMGLTSIRTLDVSYNAVSSTVPLTGLVSLQDLNLAGNPVSNFTGLAGLTNLKSLNLASTGIDDAASVGLYGLTGLSQLNLENNPAFTGDGYDKLRAYMPGCRILHSDLVYSVPAQSLTISSNTTVLDLANRGVSDLSFLMQLSNLVSANLSRNSISGVNAFQYTDSRWTLTTLDLSYNSITDVTGLSGLQNLTTLDLSNNLITNIMPLYTLRNLRELNVTGNPLSADQIRDLNAILPSCFIRY